MRRSVALLGFLALSWSQVVALHCDMGTGAPHHPAAAEHPGAPHHPAAAHHPAASGHAATSMQHAAAIPADRHAADQAPMARHGQGHDRDHGCLMIMACGYSFVRHAQSVVLKRFPGTVVRAAFLASPIPVAAEPAVETPPPRLTA